MSAECARTLARLPVPFILVTGGKGGVGKTTLAANLGVQLARDGFRVLVVDLDLGLANLDVVLGLTVERDIEDAVNGRCALADCVARGPGGVHVLPASSGSEAMGRLDESGRRALFVMLRALAAGYDVVLGDSAAGIGPDVLEFASIADRVLVVTTPDVAALTDAYGLIKALDQHGARTGGDIPTPEVVVNLSSGVEEALRIARKLRSVCERFLSRSPRQAGWIPRSTAAGAVPVAPGQRRGLEGICLRQITGRLGRLCSRPARGSVELPA